MILLGSAVAVVLIAIAAIHAYWGLGGVWPGSDAADCARRVGGFRNARAMPGPGPSFAVAAALLLAAIVAVVGSRGPSVAYAPLSGIFALGAAAVFLGRGIAGYTPAWRRLTPEMPFARYDVRYYSPLCLAIGAAFLIIASRGLLS